jgi:hypothetical protein
MALGTKNVKSSGGDSAFAPLFIEPGNCLARIMSISVDRPSFLAKDNGFKLILNLETKEDEGFVGYAVDKEDPSKGNHKGLVGRVQHGQWPFKDGISKFNNKPYTAEEGGLRFLRGICDAIGSKAVTWFESVDGVYSTMEEFVEGMNSSGIFDDIYLNWCIAGQEYLKPNGYTGIRLYLPKLEKNKVAFEIENATNSSIMVYNPDNHFQKAVVPTQSEDLVEEDGMDMSSSSADAFDDI